MISTLRRGGALVALLALPVLAQDQAPDPNTPPDSTVVEATAADAVDAAPGDAIDPGLLDSPLDYEASEQISEDLSVSFPVDI